MCTTNAYQNREFGTDHRVHPYRWYVDFAAENRFATKNRVEKRPAQQPLKLDLVVWAATLAVLTAFVNSRSF